MPIDVLTIGSATKDVFLKVPDSHTTKNKNILHDLGFDVSAQCFPIGAKLDVDEFIATVGGGAINTATTFARQGFKTVCIAKVGDDLFGAELANNLKIEKIISRVSRNKKTHTDYSTIIITKDGSRTIFVKRGASSTLEKKDLKLSSLKPKWVFINPSNIKIDIIAYAIKTLKKNHAKIAINLSNSYINQGINKLKYILSNSDLVILNKEEASLLTGISQNKDKELFKALDNLVYGTVVMTDGPRGLTISNGKKVWQAGIFKNQKVIDRTGAGDAFGSGFVSGLIHTNENNLTDPQDANIKQAIILGSANATSVVEKYGAKAGILTYKEFKNSQRWNLLPIKVTTI